MLRILETELISDFADGFAGVEYFFFCDIDQFGLDMLLSAGPNSPVFRTRNSRSANFRTG